MVNCKNCIHNPVCDLLRSNGERDAASFQLSGCDYFQDRSMFVELPCPIGSTVYIIGHRYRAGWDECWINPGKFRPSDLENLGVRVFLTYEDAKAKIFATNKGNHRFRFIERSGDNA